MCTLGFQAKNGVEKSSKKMKKSQENLIADYADCTDIGLPRGFLFDFIDGKGIIETSDRRSQRAKRRVCGVRGVGLVRWSDQLQAV